MSGSEIWDDAYSNAKYIPSGNNYPELWARIAADFRSAMLAESHASLDVTYGPHERNRYDLFHPGEPAKGLVVFVHGGYWLDFDKSFWSWLAKGPTSLGWTVAMPSYSLAPNVRLREITLEIAQAIEKMAEDSIGPIRLVGHSAGGHLITRMICDDSPLSRAAVTRIDRCVTISGLHDLRPLLKTSMNEQLRLDNLEADQESPALHFPVSDTSVVCRVGANERPEFLRQSQLLFDNWQERAAEITMDIVPGAHHFNIIEDLAAPESSLTRYLTRIETRIEQ